VHARERREARYAAGEARRGRALACPPLRLHMSGYPVTSQPDERPPSPGSSTLKRFVLAALVIVALSGGATATLALNELSGLAHEILPPAIRVPKGVVTEVYNGGPQTFLILGSDRRVGAKDAFDRENPPHSDTILLVRFDPGQGQTSVMSVPRDLLVGIRTKSGQDFGKEKLNAAYTIGNKLGGTRGGMVLAAETIKREVFPELQLNGIVDVSFAGFIKVVDTLGCAYVNVDHRYYNLNVGSTETDYTSIDLQPGYQKLCYENALDYVRYRHTDSDFVRVARQQDFLRDLREQISAGDALGQIHTVAKAVGHAISSTFHASASELLELTKLIAFSQGKPLRQVKFRTTNVDYQVHGASYVTTTAALEHQTLEDFLHGHEQTAAPTTAAPVAHGSHRRRRRSHHVSARALGLYPSGPSSADAEVAKAAVKVPFVVLYPTLQTGPAERQAVRPYALRDRHNALHHAYVIVWRQNTLGSYYDFEGSDWLNPPLFAHARTQTIAGRSYRIVDDGAHIHVIGWRSGRVLYWLTNTLLEDLSNAQMIALARSAQRLH
jgi:polyisoprenyl-teichoic acid--peptidoglycan teichoic acid transferase